MSTPTDADRFRTAYLDAYDDVHRFVRRRVGPDRADDVVAEAMLAAWRRVEDLPRHPDDARAWMFGIARNCLLNDARAGRRRDALAVRLATESELLDRPGHDRDAPDEAVADRLDLARAWRDLTPGEQEVLALTAFEGLDSPHAAAVLGISSAAYRLRLSRARRALRRRLEGAASDARAATTTTPLEATR